MPTTAVRAVPDATAEPTITAKRVAAILGISIRHAYAAIERGDIPSIRVGRKVVVPTARFLAQYSDLVPEQTQAA
ncbi:helix-turn-helix domain-containing protein [Micromonospora coerulea]|uniref:helix-turn-helix domain-containing protein n=1 Tax=Micromonospora coerulea TaxID=47856 RepID=UPI0019056CC4|nr:helix-turn-helix domain-containing protein [Micromonospora veneta]